MSKLKTALCKIKLSASVPPAVKIISLADTFKCFAIFFLAVSIAYFAFLPNL